MRGNQVHRGPCRPASGSGLGAFFTLMMVGLLTVTIPAQASGITPNWCHGASALYSAHVRPIYTVKLSPDALDLPSGTYYVRMLKDGVYSGDYYRPWGQPYIITLDLDADDQCAGLFYPTVRAPVAIWSKGPDGKFDRLSAAGVGDNKDNVLGWK